MHRLDPRTVDRIAEIIVDRDGDQERQGWQLERLLRHAGWPAPPEYDTSPRVGWLRDALLARADQTEDIARVLRRVCDPLEYDGGRPVAEAFRTALNIVLEPEGLAITYVGGRPIIQATDTDVGAVLEADRSPESGRTKMHKDSELSVAHRDDMVIPTTGTARSMSPMVRRQVSPGSDRDAELSREQGTPAAVRIFISYSHRDWRLCQELVRHLTMLRRQGVIDDWTDRKINPGVDWKQDIHDALQRSAIFLLLVSPDLLASDYCYEVELHQALERHKNGTIKVIPIIVRPTDWHSAPFGQLQALPVGAKPVVSWRNRDEAWLDVVTQLRTLITATR